MKERISGAEDSIENMDTTIKENAKCKKILLKSLGSQAGLRRNSCPWMSWELRKR